MLVFCRGRDATKTKQASEEMLGAARIERVRVVRAHLDLTRVFARLAELEVNDVLVEAGPRLRRRLVRARASSTSGCSTSRRNYWARTRDRWRRCRALTRLEAAPGFELRDVEQVVGRICACGCGRGRNRKK